MFRVKMRGDCRGVLLQLVVLCAACGAMQAQSSTPDQGYLRSLEKFKADLVADRKQNWLTLAGLFWLKPGENTFGSDTGSALVFPAGAPPRAGSFWLDGKDVTVKFASGVKAVVDGRPATTAKLQADISGNPTMVELGSLRFHVIQRGDRVGIRLQDVGRAANAYRDPIFYPVNGAYRVEATWIASDGAKTVAVPNVLGDVTVTKIPGELRFTVAGQEVRLSAVGGDAAKGLFVVFSDATRKSETYPGGRFLDTGPVKDGQVLLDFNYAYNPPCSVTPYATCPLPPKENQLSAAIPAGEKYDRQHGHN